MNISRNQFSRLIDGVAGFDQANNGFQKQARWGSIQAGFLDYTSFLLNAGANFTVNSDGEKLWTVSATRLEHVHGYFPTAEQLKICTSPHAVARKAILYNPEIMFLNAAEQVGPWDAACPLNSQLFRMDIECATDKLTSVADLDGGVVPSDGVLILPSEMWKNVGGTGAPVNMAKVVKKGDQICETPTRDCSNCIAIEKDPNNKDYGRHEDPGNWHLASFCRTSDAHQSLTSTYGGQGFLTVFAAVAASLLLPLTALFSRNLCCLSAAPPFSLAYMLELHRASNSRYHRVVLIWFLFVTVAFFSVRVLLASGMISGWCHAKFDDISGNPSACEPELALTDAVLFALVINKARRLLQKDKLKFNQHLNFKELSTIMTTSDFLISPSRFREKLYVALSTTAVERNNTTLLDELFIDGHKEQARALAASKELLANGGGEGMMKKKETEAEGVELGKV